MKHSHGKGDVRAPAGESSAGKWSKYQGKAPAAQADWGEVPATAIHAAISAVTVKGDAIIFGTTRDGGALVLTVCSGDERGKWYASDPEVMASHLEEVRAIAES